MPTIDAHRRLAALACDHLALTGIPLTWRCGAGTWTVFTCGDVLVHGTFERVEAEVDDLDSVRQFWDAMECAINQQWSE